MQQEWIVELPDRLDTFLAFRLGGLSRTRIQKAIQEGHVRINDEKVTKVALRLQEGDQVVVSLPDASPPSAIASRDLDLHLLYEDGACCVVEKPAGTASHPAPGMSEEETTMLHGLKYLFEKKKIPFHPSHVLAHRLDRETTGCLLVAKSPEAHNFLQDQFASRTVSKTYLALVAGVPEPAEAVIDSPVGRHALDGTKMSVVQTGNTREAQTRYRTHEAKENVALLVCNPVTGRTHQVRVHLSSVGHPILGDGTYRSPLSDRLSQEFDIRTLCLHAWKLTFVSPDDKKRHTVVSPLPIPFENALRRIGITWK
jgi:23S rRNA pseudouridine1911/1915/1917 synthase